MLKRDEERDEELDETLDDDLDDDAFGGSELERELEQDLIEEWCPMCKDIRPHAIVSKDKIACAECNHEHKRQAEPVGVPAPRGLITEAERANPELLKAAWTRLTTEAEQEAQPYSIKLKLAEGDLIRHAKFGLGVVVEMTDVNKADILFEDAIHRLVCGK